MIARSGKRHSPDVVKPDVMPAGNDKFLKRQLHKLAALFNIRFGEDDSSKSRGSGKSMSFDSVSGPLSPVIASKPLPNSILKPKQTSRRYTPIYDYDPKCPASFLVSGLTWVVPIAPETDEPQMAREYIVDDEVILAAEYCYASARAASAAAKKGKRA